MTRRLTMFALGVFLANGLYAQNPIVPEVRTIARIEVETVWSAERDVAKRTLFSWIAGDRGEDLFVRPYAVAWGQGVLYVTDPGQSAVVGLKQGDRPVRSPDNAVESPVGVTYCEGDVYVSDSARGGIVRLSADLRTAEGVGVSLRRPTGLVCTEGRLFVAETGAHRVVEIEAGRIVASFGRRGSDDGEFNYPTLLAAFDGKLYVGDAMNFRVQRFDLEGRHLGTFGELGDTPGSMPRMKGLAIDSDGNVWMSDAYLDRVAVFDSSGAFLLDVGSHGTGVGEFSFPAGIAVATDGRVAVGDSSNARVQILAISREQSR